MARKRMFDKTIIDSDDFLELPITSQALYFHLNMRADDDGFVNNWKAILKMTGTKEDDLKLLIVKSFVIPFESGVIVIKHWRINNFLRKDRHTDTKFQKELSMLSVADNQEYVWLTSGQPSIEKNRIEKNRIDNIYSRAEKEEKIPYKEIIDYLNFKVNTKYKDTTKKTRSLIKSRFNEGFTLEDFKQVIDKKCVDWLRDKDMSRFLRPETLFGTKFESYLNQKEGKITTKDLANNMDFTDFLNEGRKQ